MESAPRRKSGTIGRVSAGMAVGPGGLRLALVEEQAAARVQNLMPPAPPQSLSLASRGLGPWPRLFAASPRRPASPDRAGMQQKLR